MHIDLNAINSFSKIITRMIKCAAGLNMYKERIKKIDKKNDNAECPLYTKEESMERVMLCDRSNKIREDWLMSMKDKFQKIEKKINAAIC